MPVSLKSPIQKFANKLAKALSGEMRESLRRIESRLDAIEHLSHGGRATYVGNNRVLAKFVVGGYNFGFLLEADDRLLTPWFIISGAFETPLTDYFLREVRPDSHCIDAGANFGYFTCLMARLAPSGLVRGIEPDRHVYELARDNLAINGLAKVGAVMHLAAADQKGELTLYRRPTRSANTSIIACSEAFSAKMGETPSERFVVPSAPIDSLLDSLKGRLDFMKVDVEGAEPLVFRGAQKTIASNPTLQIIMEWSPGQIRGAGFDPRAFLSELEAMGLRAYEIEAGGAPLSMDEVNNMSYSPGILLKQ